MALKLLETQQGLYLRSAPNGGWILEARPADRGVMPEILGAYSSASDMLDDLTAALVPVSEVANG